MTNKYSIKHTLFSVDNKLTTFSKWDSETKTLHTIHRSCKASDESQLLNLHISSRSNYEPRENGDYYFGGASHLPTEEFYGGLEEAKALLEQVEKDLGGMNEV